MGIGSTFSSEFNRASSRPGNSTYGDRSFGIRYPSPFFDVAQQFLPTTQHQLHLWCRYYFLTNPIINVAVTKMAEYPVTKLVYDTKDAGIHKLYRGLERRLKLRAFQIEVGLDYFGYGNAFVSIYYPFEKYLICKSCKSRHRASTNRSIYKWKQMRFHMRCPECKHEGFAREADVYQRSIRDINLIRWNPENIELKHDEHSGKTRYYYKVPKTTINDVRIGDMDAILSLPTDFLEAVRKRKALRFHRDNFYHLKAPTIAQKDKGWGQPLIYPLLKDAFYMQVMKKSQEALLMEHIVPMRFIYPGPVTGGNEPGAPYGSYNLSNWKSKIDYELNRWKRDKNYIPILPMNVGVGQLGGTAKALILHQEFRVHAENMLAGAGIPVEFVYGGLQWSGSNTSLQALANKFETYNGQREELIVDFVLGNIAKYMKWPEVDARFDRFRMADDLQKAMFYFQLNQANKMSDRRVLEEIGEDYDREVDRMDNELKTTLRTQRKMQLASADVQGESMLRQSRYQAKASKLQMEAQMEAQMAAGGGMPPEGQPGMEQPGMGPPGGPQDGQDQSGQLGQEEQPNQSALPVALAQSQSQMTPGSFGLDIRLMAQRAAAYLRTIKEEQGEQVMNQELELIEGGNPDLGQMVRQILGGDSGSQVDPMNAQKAPIPAGGSQRPAGRQAG